MEDFLKKCGLSNAVGGFERHQINVDQLNELTGDLIKELLPMIGDRLKLIKGINERKVRTSRQRTKKVGVERRNNKVSGLKKSIKNDPEKKACVLQILRNELHVAELYQNGAKILKELNLFSFVDGLSGCRLPNWSLINFNEGSLNCILCNSRIQLQTRQGRKSLWNLGNYKRHFIEEHDNAKETIEVSSFLEIEFTESDENKDDVEPMEIQRNSSADLFPSSSVLSTVTTSSTTDIANRTITTEVTLAVNASVGKDYSHNLVAAEDADQNEIEDVEETYTSPQNVFAEDAPMGVNDKQNGQPLESADLLKSLICDGEVMPVDAAIQNLSSAEDAHFHSTSTMSTTLIDSSGLIGSVSNHTLSLVDTSTEPSSVQDGDSNNFDVAEESDEMVLQDIEQLAVTPMDNENIPGQGKIVVSGIQQTADNANVVDVTDSDKNKNVITEDTPVDIILSDEMGVIDKQNGETLESADLLKSLICDGEVMPVDAAIQNLSSAEDAHFHSTSTMSTTLIDSSGLIGSVSNHTLSLVIGVHQTADNANVVDVTDSEINKNVITDEMGVIDRKNCGQLESADFEQELFHTNTQGMQQDNSLGLMLNKAHGDGRSTESYVQGIDDGTTDIAQHSVPEWRETGVEFGWAKRSSQSTFFPGFLLFNKKFKWVTSKSVLSCKTFQPLEFHKNISSNLKNKAQIGNLREFNKANVTSFE